MARPLTVPTGATARRRTWGELPEAVRARIERRLGATVREAESQGSGFTPGFASRLLLSDGRGAFVKAADDATQPTFAASYRDEVRKVSALPSDVAVPALRWSCDVDGWVVLCFDDVRGHPPRRPWRSDELAAVLNTVTALSSALTPVPAGLTVPTWAEELAGFVTYWGRFKAAGVLARHSAEAIGLAEQGLGAGAGDTMAHCDLRDDNVVIGNDGRIWVCDWNWPVRAAPWIDLLTLLISAHGDGHDADALLRANSLASGVAAERIDAVLALLVGYFLGAAEGEAPATSPWIRIHQRWYGHVTTDWLAQRRAWR